ncbi:DUF2570 family protein [Enterobacter hormaechei]|uniref:Uncharacterized protein n=1 Tax=Salmonella phage ZCSE2 TaxID=2562175 RepID=A0A4D6DVY2_9CAUD|nr:hypothetical protein HOV36_gp27 [Salmonella phage ZCSE2]MEA4022395.1 DUF2570 family protein [Enterobacter hormaechei]QBZ70530.1 hypothetical protein [Salmonella phage ZCSE2]UOK16627.1 putative spanin inner membrane subunit [Salmonella phage S1]WQZ00472.1 hypothetical protein AEV23_00028 [Klebsiella phage VB_KpM-AEV23]
MSKTGAVIITLFGIAIVLLCLWVKSLKQDIQIKDDTIEQITKDNKELSTANTELRGQIAVERNASADMALKNKELEDKLKERKPKYDAATKNDACANTNAPDGVIDLMQ